MFEPIVPRQVDGPGIAAHRVIHEDGWRDAVRPGHTAIVYSPYELTTGTFARDPSLEVPGAALR